MVVCIFMSSNAYAGTFLDVDGHKMYATDNGTIVKDSWIWIDTNNDSIAECYRFDKDGYIAINYEDQYGRKTNDKGQLIEGDIVIKKMLSNGKIIKDSDKPDYGIFSIIGNIINRNKDTSDKNKKKSEIEYESLPYDVSGTNNGILYNIDTDDGSVIGPNVTPENGVIYAGGRESTIEDNVQYDKKEKAIAGKDIRKFISAKNKCTEKVDSVYVYGNDIWNDCLELSGYDASVKFLLDGYNYMYFEVSHQTHYEETDDTNLTLDMYVDNELVESFDEFVDGDPEIIEEYFDKGKTVELKVNIKSGSLGRKVYIRHGRFRKIKEENMP